MEDKDYRMFHKSLPVPPPPPITNQMPIKMLSKKLRSHSPKKMQDNVESIDMELSDDDTLDSNNLTTVPIQDKHNKNSFKDNITTLEPPPPFPDILEDVDPNNIIIDDTGMEMQKKDWLMREDLKQHLDNNYLLSINDRVWTPGAERMPHNNNNNNIRGAIRNSGYLRNSMEFRGRGGRGNTWNYRGAGSFRPRGSPRPPPYARGGGGLIRGRGFPRGNFRGGY